MGEGLRFSENGGESEPGDDEGVVCAAASSRYHKRHEMFSRRRPSFRDSLHFVNTLCRGRLQHGKGEDERGKRKHTSPKTTQGIFAFKVLDYIRRDGQDRGRKSRNHGIEELQGERTSGTDMKGASEMVRKRQVLGFTKGPARFRSEPSE